MASVEVLDEVTANWSQQFWAQIEVRGFSMNRNVMQCSTPIQPCCSRIRKLVIWSTLIQSAVNVDGLYSLERLCEL